METSDWIALGGIAAAAALVFTGFVFAHFHDKLKTQEGRADVVMVLQGHNLSIKYSKILAAALAGLRSVTGLPFSVRSILSCAILTFLYVAISALLGWGGGGNGKLGTLQVFSEPDWLPLQIRRDIVTVIVIITLIIAFISLFILLECYEKLEDKIPIFHYCKNRITNVILSNFVFLIVFTPILYTLFSAPFLIISDQYFVGFIFGFAIFFGASFGYLFIRSGVSHVKTETLQSKLNSFKLLSENNISHDIIELSEKLSNTNIYFERYLINKQKIISVCILAIMLISAFGLFLNFDNITAVAVVFLLALPLINTASD